MAKERKHGAVQPGFKWGPFTTRVPFYHVSLEWVDLLQGVVVTAATSMALVPLLISAFGLSFDEAIACSMIHTLLISSGPIIFGCPFAPGWITPAFPITVAYVMGNYVDPGDRFSAMTAISMDFAAILLFFGVTGLGQKFIAWLPRALKGGIIMGASIASFKRVFFDDIETFMKQPIATSVALAVCLIFTFSTPFEIYKKNSKFLTGLGNLGLLPGFICAIIVGTLVGEVTFDIQWGVMMPPVGDLLEKVSPFYIGWPPLEMFLAGLPLAFVAYTIAFGDLITGIEVIKDAGKSREDETVDICVKRSHYSVGIRNVLMAITAPFFPTQGVLWTGVHVVLVQRWRQGRTTMESLHSGIASYYMFGLPVIFFILPVITALAPMMSITLSISLVLTGFACAYVAMAIPKTPAERGVAIMMGVAMATMEPWLSLVLGIAATFLISGIEREEQEDVEDRVEEYAEESEKFADEIV